MSRKNNFDKGSNDNKFAYRRSNSTYHGPAGFDKLEFSKNSEIQGIHEIVLHS